MYIVEKIGDLILITIENDILTDEIDQIKERLAQLASVSENNVVVSFYYENGDLDKATRIDNEINNLLKYCDSVGLRVYSYRSE